MAIVIDVASDEYDESFKSLVKDKRAHCFLRRGGGAGIATALGSHPERGICGDEADVRRRKGEYGENTYPKLKQKSFFSHVRDALSDVLLIALLVCATVALAFGVEKHRLKDVVYDCLSIFITVLLVSGVAASISHIKAKFNEKWVSESADIAVTVHRAGRRQDVSLFDVVVGDVVILKTGHAVPADGVFLKGHGLQVDESSITCEPRPVQIDAEKNPFLASGVNVVHGHGSMVVTAVGTDTTWGELINIEDNADDPTPLRERLEVLSSTIGKIGVAVAMVILTVRHFTGGTEKLALLDKGIQLPLAVTLMVALYMTIQMAKNNLHSMSALETMASVTAICADKTGTLTMNEIEVTEFWIGTEQPTAIDHGVLSLLRQGAGLNTTGSVYWPDNVVSPPEISGSSTEKALLSWAVTRLDMDAATFKKCGKVLYVEALNPSKKHSRAKIKNRATGAVVAHWKGAAEVLVAKCSMYVDMHGAAHELGVEQRNKLEEVINGMAVGGLKPIAFAYKQSDDKGLTLLGLVGLKDPCRSEVKTAIEDCANAGVSVKMLTGDSIGLAARAIAKECGIISSNDPDDVVIEGRKFRTMARGKQLEMVDKIRVIFGARPADKRLLVKLLKHKGQVVALTSNGTTDELAHRDADVVLSMSVKGTDVAKETIVLDDNKFDTVVTAIRRGRWAYNYFQRFIQFHLTVNVVAILVSFLSTITTGSTPPLTTAQIMWVNLVMGTMSALSVAADKPTEALMSRPPIDRKAPLISNTMLLNLAAQAAFQTAVLLALQYRGRDVFGTGDKANGIMMFNIFVLCQVFNGFNVRDIEKRNVFAGVLEKTGMMYLVLVALTLVLQTLTVEVIARFAGIERLGLGFWGVCLAIAAVSWPVGWAVKLVGGACRPAIRTDTP